MQIRATLIGLLMSCCAAAAEPRVTDNHYKLELVAKEPEIVTPVGMAFDRGNLLVIESHTHERPKEYQGPTSDRIRMLSDSNHDGRLDRWSTFAEGFRHATNLLKCDDGSVYLVTRGSVVLLQDIDNDGVAETKKELIRLETKDDYPHNALNCIALERRSNKLLLSMGENHGIFYRLIGSDGKELTGRDGAGTIFECSRDGSGLRRMAVGFWNPFSLCAVPDGRVFAVDNDPDASPPCRLVNVVWGGDYGFRYQYGRAGTHPLQAWNGELPGTLPMVCGVGEAPTAIVPHGGALWVTSWGDHRIERYKLVESGASYGATREIIVQGGADFRPTGMAVAPDGSLYFGDWVLRDYPVHGHGRIWRLVLPPDEARAQFPRFSEQDFQVRGRASYSFFDGADSKDPFEAAACAYGLTKRPIGSIEKWGTQPPKPLNARERLTRFEVLRLRGTDKVETLLREALADESPDVRLFAVRWVADERLMSLRTDVAKLLDGPQPSARYYLAILGAVDWLDHEPSLRGVEIADELLVRELENDDRAPAAHAIALKLLKPDNKFLTLDRLREFLHSEHEPLRLEAVRSLAQQSKKGRFKVLAEVAADDSQSDGVRVEAIVGLSASAEQNRGLLEKLSAVEHAVVRQEAARAIRLAGLQAAKAEAKPQADDVGAWKKLLNEPGDAAAGRRLFFSPVGARCSVCHKYDGRGGNVGPDLTEVARSTSRERIINSILQPSQEIAPDYQAWNLTTDDGKTYTGLRLPKPGDNGKEDYVDSAGKTFTLASTSIEERQVSSKSIMPDNLQAILNIADLRDLVTFLATPSE